MTVRIVDSLFRTRNCQPPAIGLAICFIICVGSDSEVSHLVNDGALEEITSQSRTMEYEEKKVVVFIPF